MAKVKVGNKHSIFHTLLWKKDSSGELHFNWELRLFSPLTLYSAEMCMINRHQSVDFNLITQRNNHGLSSRVSRIRLSCDSEASKSSSRKNYARILRVTQLSDFTSALATKEIEKQQKKNEIEIYTFPSKSTSERKSSSHFTLIE